MNAPEQVLGQGASGSFEHSMTMNKGARMPFGLSRTFVALNLVLALGACWPEEDTGTTTETAPIRGVITTLIAEVEEVTIRRYPGVLEPSEVNLLSLVLSQIF